MAPSENPGSSPEKPKLTSKHGMSPDEVEVARRRIQEKLREKAPEKALESTTYETLQAYVLRNSTSVLSEGSLYDAAELNGFWMNVAAAQASLKSEKRNPLPIYPGESTEIKAKIDSKELASSEGELMLLGINNAVLICRDGGFFQVRINDSAKTMTFVFYTDEYFE